MVSRASRDLSLLFSWSHLTRSGLTRWAEREELQGTAALLGHPDSAVKTQSPGGMAERDGESMERRLQGQGDHWLQGSEGLLHGGD